jgi:hypothetical protein
MKSGLRYRAVTAILLLSAAAGGCDTMPTATSVTHSYDPHFSFSGSKTYAWVKAKSYGHNPLVEANVRFVADREFQAKGLSLAPDKPALLAWVGYEPDSYYYGSSSDLRVLTLNVARADDKELVWQGRARGSIRTDASSGELKKAVEAMLANFPPK